MSDYRYLEKKITFNCFDLIKIKQIYCFPFDEVERYFGVNELIKEATKILCCNFSELSQDEREKLLDLLLEDDCPEEQISFLVQEANLLDLDRSGWESLLVAINELEFEEAEQVYDEILFEPQASRKLGKETWNLILDRFQELEEYQQDIYIRKCQEIQENQLFNYLPEAIKNRVVAEIKH